MGALDDQIQVILYACYAVYLLMGIGLITMGAVYMGDTGAVGSTGGSLLFIGLFMLVVGGLAIFANYGENWTILAVIEVISLGLFLFLTATIVVSVLFALGYTDPVRSIIDDNWSSIAHNEGQGYNADPRSICFRYLSSCEEYADAYIAKPDGDTLGCSREDPVEFTAGDRDTYFADSFVSNFSEYKSGSEPKTSRSDSAGGGTLKDASQKNMGGYTGQLHCHFPSSSSATAANCSFFNAAGDAETIKTTAACAENLPKTTEQMCAFDGSSGTKACNKVKKWTASCDSEQTNCETCQRDCKDYLTNEARAGTEAVALFVFATVAFCLAAVIYNNFLTRDDNDEYEGVMQILAFAINGSVLLIGFVMIVMCIIRLVGSDGYTALLLMLLFLGLFLLIAGGLAVLGIKQGNPTFINIACIFLALFGYVMLILGVVLAVCTGYIMNEAQVQYDQNYSKLREAVEKMDPAFCQLSTPDCEQITVFKDVNVKISPTSTSTHDADQLWERQYQEMQKQADWMETQAFVAAGDSTFRAACISNVVCVACNGLFSDTGDSRGRHMDGGDQGTVSEKGAYNGGGLWNGGDDYPSVVEADRNFLASSDFRGPIGRMGTTTYLKDPDRSGNNAKRAETSGMAMGRSGKGGSGFYFVGVDIKHVYETIKKRYSLQDFKVCVTSGVLTTCNATNWGSSGAAYYARDKDAASPVFTGDASITDLSNKNKRARSGGVVGNKGSPVETYNGDQYESCRLHPNTIMFAPGRRGSITGCSGPWRRDGYEPSIPWTDGSAFKNADVCKLNDADDACTVATAPACALGWQYRSTLATEYVWTTSKCDGSHVGALGRVTAGPGATLVQWNPTAAGAGAGDFSWCPAGCTTDERGPSHTNVSTTARTESRYINGDKAKDTSFPAPGIPSAAAYVGHCAATTDGQPARLHDSSDNTGACTPKTNYTGVPVYYQAFSQCSGGVGATAASGSTAAVVGTGGDEHVKITWPVAIGTTNPTAAASVAEDRTGTKCAAKVDTDGSCRVGPSEFTCVSFKDSQSAGDHCVNDGKGVGSAVYGFNVMDRINTCPKGCKITYTEVSAKWGGDCTKDGDSCKAGCLFVAGTGKGNFGQRTDADTKAFLGEYITNVTAAWKNRTLFDSHIASTNGRAGLQPKVTQATGRCEGALQHWATSADCKKNVKDFGDSKDDASFDADVAGCKHCSSVILNSLTASEAALNTDIKNGYDWSRCLRAMYRKANTQSGSTATSNWGKVAKCDPATGRTACAGQLRADKTIAAQQTEIDLCANCDAAVETSPQLACPLLKVRCERFRTLRVKMPHTFCQFTDAACKTKLKEKMEDDMSVVAWVGIIFCVLFLGILYFTYRGVVVYMSGDDDDE